MTKRSKRLAPNSLRRKKIAPCLPIFLELYHQHPSTTSSGEFSYPPLDLFMPTYFKIPFHKSISDGDGKVVGVYPQVSNSPGESSSARACYVFHNKNCKEMQ